MEAMHEDSEGPPKPYTSAEFEEDGRDDAMQKQHSKRVIEIDDAIESPAPPNPFNAVDLDDEDEVAKKKKKKKKHRQERRSDGYSSRSATRDEEKCGDEIDASRGEGDAQASREASPRSRRGSTEREEGGEEVQLSQWQTVDADDAGGTSRGRGGSVIRSMSSMLMAHVSPTGEHLVSATLVEEDDREVVMAEPVSFFDKKAKIFASALCVMLVIIATLAALFTRTKGSSELGIGAPATDVPSMHPSSPPSFDPRPTYEIIQDRGYVICGLRDAALESEDNFRHKLCRAVAAVLFGDPNSYEGFPVTIDDRFHHLHDRTVDLLLYGDTHTIEREVNEITTGAGFTFSSPYYYEDLTYFGNETFVRCAAEYQLYAVCSSLKICVNEDSVGFDFVQPSFPGRFFLVGSTLREVTEMLLNNTCNVIADGRSLLLDVESSIKSVDGKFVVGNTTNETEPHAVVTRNNDPEFSDIINWVVQALFYGEEQGLGKNSSLCRKYANVTSPQGLDFLKAVHCVGSYSEVCGEGLQHLGLNRVNNGTGMHYVTPFGDLERKIDLGGFDDTNVRLAKIRREGSLRCGVIVPEGFDGDLDKSRGRVGMNVDYCRALAAALFMADSNRVLFTAFSEEDNGSFFALNNGTVDVLAGAKVGKKYTATSQSLGGFHFSTPYFYGNEAVLDDVSCFSLATPKFLEDDELFASFVNCVVVATLYAAENGITNEKRQEMPLLQIFGNGSPKWALRNVIFYSGSYDQLYEKHFGDVSVESRGRNHLNDRDPQIHSFPGLSH